MNPFDENGSRETDPDLICEMNWRELALETSPVVFYRRSIKTNRLLFVSANVAEAIGYSMDDVLSSPTWLFDQCHPEDRERALAPITKVSGTMEKREYRIRQGQTDEYVWFRDYVNVQYDGKGEPQVFFGFLLNINAEVEANRSREKAFLDLKKISDRLTLCLSSIRMGIWDWDLVSGHLEWDPSVFPVYGVDPKKFVASFESWTSLLIPGEKDKAVAEIELALSGKKEFDTSFAILSPADGKQRVIGAKAFVTRDSAGRPVRMTGVNWDITEMAGLKSRVERDAQFQQLILDNIPAALFCKDPEKNFQITLWNKMAEQVFGVSAEEAIGKTVFDFFPQREAQLIQGADEQTMRDGKVQASAEEKITNARGEEVCVKTLTVPVVDPNSRFRYLLGISEDITELRKAQVNAFHNSKLGALGEMASGIGHEINNPIAVIHGKISLLKERLSSGLSVKNADLVRDLTMIDEMSLRISAIAKAMRSLSRNEFSDSPRGCRLQEILTDVLSVCGEKFRTHDIDLRLNVPEGIMIHCLPGQLAQVLINLLSNSFDAILGQEQKWIDVSVRKCDGGDKVQIAVSDSGPPIKQIHRDKLMQPFFSTKPPGKGTGLGLSISARLLEGQGGKLLFDGNSKNTTFVIEIPLGHEPVSRSA